MADDPLAAALAEKRIALVGGSDERCYEAGQALLGALNAAVKHHQPVQLYWPVEDHRGKTVCGHDPDYDGDAHFEADNGIWCCKNHPLAAVCSTCRDESENSTPWPCDEYTAILAALTGEGKADGTTH